MTNIRELTRLLTLGDEIESLLLRHLLLERRIDEAPDVRAARSAQSDRLSRNHTA